MEYIKSLILVFVFVTINSSFARSEDPGRKVVLNYCNQLKKTQGYLVNCLNMLNGNSGQWNSIVAKYCVDIKMPSSTNSCLKLSKNKIYTGQQINKIKSIILNYRKYPEPPLEAIKKILSSGKVLSPEGSEPKVEGPSKSGLIICDKIKKYNKSLYITCKDRFRKSRFHPYLLDICNLTAGYNTWYKCLAVTEEKSVYPELASICAKADKFNNEYLFKCIEAVTVEGSGISTPSPKSGSEKVQ